jgi:hypothetical protein
MRFAKGSKEKFITHSNSKRKEQSRRGGRRGTERASRFPDRREDTAALAMIAER